jgi:VacB/RNase II family 3'-5' exoribonuclease
MVRAQCLVLFSACSLWRIALRRRLGRYRRSTSMNGSPPSSARSTLQRIAQRVMQERGLEPDFSPDAMAELEAIHGPAPASAGTRDLRSLLWCSIDNDDSRDLDQLSVAEQLPDGGVKVLVAIADVSATVAQDSALDAHARQNTTSVYTVAQIFPMLPEKLSTNLTSLNPDADRRAMVVEMGFAADGTLTRSDIYEAQVRNRAKLAYNSVAAWLEGTGPAPAALTAVAGLAENLRLQDSVARRLGERRHTQGALMLETIQTRPVFDGADLRDLTPEQSNRAKHLIEDFMIAANGVTARFLASRRFPSIRRVVRTPKNWDRIVELAAARQEALPARPDAKALAEFLERAKAADPIHFPDLSLSVIKLLGAGEYVLELPGANSAGHFGLAVKDYAHSTAPNRRFPDVITQRLLKAALAGRPPSYALEALGALAAHCTEQEDEAKKVERQVAKSAAALLLAPRLGNEFNGLITGASEKGTWVRLFQPPVEGRLVRNFERYKVGDRVRVRLLHTDVERGYLDFAGVS